MRKKLNYTSVLIIYLCLGLVMPSGAIARDIQPGELLTLVLVADKPGAEQLARDYTERAFPLAESHGMQEVVTLKVKNTVVGDEAMHSAALFTWPSADSARKSRENPEYVQHIRPLRQQAWNQMIAMDMVFEEPLTLTLDATKTYSLALIWAKDELAYMDYYQKTQALRDRLGSTTVIEAEPIRYEDLNAGVAAPPRLVVMLEWEDGEAMMEYARLSQESPLYPQFQQSISRFDWYQLVFWD